MYMVPKMRAISTTTMPIAQPFFMPYLHNSVRSASVHSAASGIHSTRSASSEAAVNLVGDAFDEGDKTLQSFRGVQIGGLAPALPNIEDRDEGIGSGADELGDVLDDFAARVGHGLPESNQSVAEQNHKGGNGGVHQADDDAIARGNGQDSLTEAKRIDAKFAFDLLLVQLHGDFQFVEEILAIEHAMAIFHVE